MKLATVLFHILISFFCFSLEYGSFLLLLIQSSYIMTSCVIVADGKVIASGRNRTTETRNVRLIPFFFLSYIPTM